MFDKYISQWRLFSEDLWCWEDVGQLKIVWIISTSTHLPSARCSWADWAAHHHHQPSTSFLQLSCCHKPLWGVTSTDVIWLESPILTLMYFSENHFVEIWDFISFYINLIASTSFAGCCLSSPILTLTYIYNGIHDSTSLCREKSLT